MLYLLKTKSEKIRTVECSAKELNRHARTWTDIDGEVMEVFVCVKVREFSPTVHIPKGTPKKEAMRLRKIGTLKAELNTAINTFYHLPKKGSFSGIHWADEIDRIQKELDQLEDKSKRIYPEVNIEVG